MCQELICLILCCLGNGLLVTSSRISSAHQGISLEDNLLNQNMSLKHVVVDFHAKHVGMRYSNFTIRSPRAPTNDVVSKNITMVLENLLKNYESSQLPTHGMNSPTTVKTNILIRSMGPVSELDMEYSMDCYFRQYWRDQRLSFFGPIKSLSLSIKMLERIWRPDTYFYNGKNSYVHTITVPNKLLRISQDGDILYSMRLTIKAKCPMELKSFPMDRQSCPLIFGSWCSIWEHINMIKETRKICNKLVFQSTHSWVLHYHYIPLQHQIWYEVNASKGTQHDWYIQDAYTSKDLVYKWQNDASVNFVPGTALSQFDVISYPYRNFTLKRREGEFSVLQVSFNLQRHTGYFLIQVYVPCILIVVLSWVSFWIHREATSDRVGLGITTVLTLSTISLDSRTDLPKVRYATALDWFLLMSFFYCIATILEFAGVHYFTKVGSGEIPVDEDDWEDFNDPEEFVGPSEADLLNLAHVDGRSRRRSSIICPIYNNSALHYGSRKTSLSSTTQVIPPPVQIRLTMERTTQTEHKLQKWKQFLYCLKGDDKFRRQRQREAAAAAANANGLAGNQHGHHVRHINSVSLIDRTARVFFPASFGIFNLFYWMAYFMTQENFKWGDTKLDALNH